MHDRGHANVLIAGRTGVGKSTLINGVFHGDFATTGQGRPVTTETREYTKLGVPLSLFDSRGLELAEFDKILAELRSFVSERRQQKDVSEHIHVAWVCIAEDLLCARHVVDGIGRHEFEGHRAGVPEALQAMAISSRLAMDPA